MDGVILEGLIFSIMALGVLISFRILDFPDLTVDGSFPLGASIMAILLINGWHPLLAILIAFAGGCLAGLCTALIHNSLKIPSLLASILTMTILYSINIRILGAGYKTIPKESVGLLKLFKTSISDFILPNMADSYILLILFIICTIIILTLFNLFFYTDLGISLGALGSNEQMVISYGMSPNILKLIGIGASNGLVAISGALYAEYFHAGDVTFGAGTIVQGLAIVMLGEFIIRSNKIKFISLSVVFGAILFRSLLFLGMSYGFILKLLPSDLNLEFGLLTIVLLWLNKNDKLRSLFRKSRT